MESVFPLQSRCIVKREVQAILNTDRMQIQIKRKKAIIDVRPV